jgi:NAD dependent epimerase/dehydratase family enzyme
VFFYFETDAIIFAEGAPMFRKPWTSQAKKYLWSTRIGFTNWFIRNLSECYLGKKSQSSIFQIPKLFICFSDANSIYGDNKFSNSAWKEDEIITIQSAHSAFKQNPIIEQTFQNNLFRNLEVEFGKISDIFSNNNQKENETTNLTHPKVVILRNGLIIGSASELLNELTILSKLTFFSGKFGDGNQRWSWVEGSDILEFVNWLFENYSSLPNYSVFNLVASSSETNNDFSWMLKKHVNSKAFISMPNWVCNSLFQDRSFRFLNDQFISNQSLLKLGFKFQFSSLPHLFGRIFQ